MGREEEGLPKKMMHNIRMVLVLNGLMSSFHLEREGVKKESRYNIRRVFILEGLTS